MDNFSGIKFNATETLKALEVAETSARIAASIATGVSKATTLEEAEEKASLTDIFASMVEVGTSTAVSTAKTLKEIVAISVQIQKKLLADCEAPVG